MLSFPGPSCRPRHPHKLVYGPRSPAARRRRPGIFLDFDRPLWNNGDCGANLSAPGPFRGSPASGAIVTDRRVNSLEGLSKTSSSLLDRARAHDQAAWDRLVGLYGPLVYRWCRAAGLQAADAADVGQEVFRAVARGLAGFRHEREGDTFRGWLRTITRNHLRNHFLRRPAGGAGGEAGQRWLEQLPAPDDAEPSADALAAETRLLFRQAVELIRGEFAEDTWRAFWQVVAEGRRPGAVAADLGVSVNTVYLAKSRVLRRLRAEFADLLAEGPAPGRAEDSQGAGE